MFNTVYLEKEIENHFRVQEILKKISFHRVISIDRYSEIFNRKNQDFLIQKKNPALILAKKYGKFIQKIKPQSGILENNYYFSPLLNCPFDCEYCFLKGFFRSAFFVLFVNYEDFKEEIDKVDTSFFFSGYDSDSLALDHITELFFQYYEWFKKSTNFIELRTKSINIQNLLKKEPIKNMVIAFSLNTKKIVNRFERAPDLSQRLNAISTLSKLGWQIGIRFDPLILYEGCEKDYIQLFEEVFSIGDLHSITLGALRYPKSCFKNFYEREKNILLSNLFEHDGFFSYEEKRVENLLNFCENYIKKNSSAKVVVHRECS